MEKETEHLDTVMFFSLLSNRLRLTLPESVFLLSLFYFAILEVVFHGIKTLKRKSLNKKEASLLEMFFRA